MASLPEKSNTADKLATAKKLRRHVNRLGNALSEFDVGPITKADHAILDMTWDEIEAAFKREEDERLARERASADAALADDEIPWLNPEHTAGGELAGLLNELSAMFRRFLHLGPGGHDILALYVAYAHTSDRHEHAPRLLLKSPFWGSGKTTVLQLLNRLGPRSKIVSNGTEAYIYGVLNQGQMLILDELDKYNTGVKATLTGILNSGFTKGAAFVGRAKKDEKTGDWVPIEYSTFKPIVFASKGRDLPPDLASRTICIDIPKLASAKVTSVEEFRSQLVWEELDALRYKVSQWAGRLPKRTQIWCEMPLGMDPRRRDTWRPLFAMAQAAGRDWPDRVRAAQAQEPEQQQDVGVRLLLDIRKVFDEIGKAQITTMDLVSRLIQQEGEWSEMSKTGKPLTGKLLGALLAPFKVEPRILEFGKAGDGKRLQRRGYTRAQFEEVWAVI